MKKTLIAVADFSGSPIHYHLLTTQTGELTQYGVRASWQGEEVSVPALTAKREGAMELLELLRRGAVPPIAVRDVVEDWLER